LQAPGNSVERLEAALASAQAEHKAYRDTTMRMAEAKDAELDRLLGANAQLRAQLAKLVS
jgi:hypothetical protein